MVSMKVFLESSTIHGLTYISTTRKYARLFWILVITSGFMGAGFLIKESFASWSESPIKTTIETLPIAKIKFPKVTVCPAKNTMTDLNYDLMIIDNLTLTEKMRDEMFKYAIETLEEDIFSISRWNVLDEANRYYNWYNGYTEIVSPYKPPFKGFESNVLPKTTYEISTSATSGSVSTQFFGEKFQPDLLERQLELNVKVYPPLIGNETILKKKNVTLHFKVEKVLITGFSRAIPHEISVDRFDMTGFSDLEYNQTTIYKNFTFESTLDSEYDKLDHEYDYENNEYNEYDDEKRQKGFIQCDLVRGVYTRDAEKIKMKLMPGFKIEWWYSGASVIPDPIFKNNEKSIQFNR